MRNHVVPFFSIESHLTLTSPLVEIGSVDKNNESDPKWTVRRDEIDSL